MIGTPKIYHILRKKGLIELLHDPCGRLDLKDGLWESTVEGAGKGVTYDREMSQKRIFYGGGASGWGFIRFHEL